MLFQPWSSRFWKMADIKNIINEGSKEMLIKADKTFNFYCMKLENTTKLLQNNITTTYRKIDDKVVRLSKEYLTLNEASRDNLNVDKRILK